MSSEPRRVPLSEVRAARDRHQQPSHLSVPDPLSPGQLAEIEARWRDVVGHPVEVRARYLVEVPRPAPARRSWFRRAAERSIR